MTEILVPIFRKFPEEAAIVGRLVLGYGELEISLCHCISMSGVGLDAAVKAMFKVRGETGRVKAAGTHGKAAYLKLNLATEFAEAISGMHYCLSIRNQYAHRQWYDDHSGKLAFVNMEEIAQDSLVISDLRGLTIFHVDTALLMQQEAYFINVATCLDYLNFEGQKRAGTLTHGHIFTWPPAMVQPALHI